MCVHRGNPCSPPHATLLTFKYCKYLKISPRNSRALSLDNKREREMKIEADCQLDLDFFHPTPKLDDHRQ
jgi:hypothetical protein